MLVGVVGHRSLTDSAAAFASQTCTRLLVGMREEHPELAALSALAVGADTCFARAALALDIPLEVIAPHAAYREDFAGRPARAEYRRLLGRARRSTCLPYPLRCDEAYRAAMRTVVDRCDVLLAVWDGKPSARAGGTADTVGYARSRRRPLVHLDPLARTVRRG